MHLLANSGVQLRNNISRKMTHLLLMSEDQTDTKLYHEAIDRGTVQIVTPAQVSPLLETNLPDKEPEPVQAKYPPKATKT